MRLGLLYINVGLLLFAGFAYAGNIVIAPFTLQNSTGTTVYGATNYTCNPCALGAPQYINNNVTGRNDILSSPGNGYQVANPVIGNNVAETPNGGAGLGNVSIPAPYVFGAAGGVSGTDGASFGAGLTVNTGGMVGFGLNDLTVGCCSASYMITSWQADFVSNGVWNDSVDAFLGLSGINGTGNDASVASLITSYSINGGAAVLLAPMTLAVAGNCVNDQATGGFRAAKINQGCGNGGAGGAFEAAALSASAVLNLNVGDVISFVSTLTVYADPASIESFVLDESLLGLLDLPSLPSGLLVGDSAVEPTPEPGTLFLLGAGLATVGVFRRRRA